MSRNRMPADRLKALIGTVHSHECYISTGGFIERAISVSGGDKAAIITYLEECKKIGFDVLETSSGFLTIPTDDWANLVKLTKSIGLKPKPEFGNSFRGRRRHCGARVNWNERS